MSAIWPIVTKLHETRAAALSASMLMPFVTNAADVSAAIFDLQEAQSFGSPGQCMDLRLVLAVAPTVSFPHVLRAI